MLGRTLFITSYTNPTNEIVIVLFNAKNKKIYFGYMYGSSSGWFDINTTAL